MIPSLVCAIKQTKRSFDNNYMKILWKKNTKNVSSKVAEKQSELSSKLHYDDEVLSIDGQYLKKL